MLYLIRSFGRRGKSYLKVGFTDTITTRMGTYRIHNPGYELISMRCGTMREELILHLYLELLGYKLKFLDEWFSDSPEVYQIFHKALDKKVMERIWVHRDKVFNIEDFKSSSLRSLFDELRAKFWDGRFRFEIDKQWKFAESKEKLYRMRKKNDPYM